MSAVLGAVTIGQSPRTDVIPELAALLPGVVFREAGALDGESPEALRRLAARPAGPLLVTRLRDGAEIQVGEADVVPRLQRAIDRLQDEAEAILLLCTGPFPALASRVPLLYPDRVLGHFVSAVFDGPVLAVLTPAEAQIPWQEKRWRERVGAPVAIVVAAASPYTADWRRAFEPALGTVRARQPSLVVMDCLGYDGAMRELVRARTGAPVALARTVLARAAAELLALPGGAG
ncbi:MAG: AroM family protein [Candidatus Rokubacteria bacterium]|nr:AroM family protein [Candidatus Rokubacteria bacterium]